MVDITFYLLPSRRPLGWTQKPAHATETLAQRLNAGKASEDPGHQTHQVFELQVVCGGVGRGLRRLSFARKWGAAGR